MLDPAQTIGQSTTHLQNSWTIGVFQNENQCDIVHDFMIRVECTRQKCLLGPADHSQRKHQQIHKKNTHQN